MPDKKDNAKALFKRAYDKMQRPARTRTILLYEMYLKYGEKGLEIAEDILDQMPPESPDFRETEFLAKMQDAVATSM